MFAATLRKVDGTMMVALPSELQTLLDARDGETITLGLAGEKQLQAQRGRRRYSLGELLDQCEPSDEALSEEDKIWANLPPAGKEL